MVDLTRPDKTRLGIDRQLTQRLENFTKNMQYRTLGKTNLKVSALSYGAAPMGGAFGQMELAEAIRAFHCALDHGINFVDVAPYYGVTRAETVLGQVLKTVPRDRYYISTKLGRYDTASFDFSPKRVRESVDESLQRLGLDYVDAMICHDIEFVPIQPILEETLPAVEQLKREGKFRYFGVSGLPLKIFDLVLPHYDLDVILTYCHYALNDTSLERLLPAIGQQNLGLILGAPLAMGLLTQAGPLPWHPSGDEIKRKCAEAAAYCTAAGVDIAQLALAFCLREPRIHTVLCGMKSEAEVQSSLIALELQIDPDVLAGVQRILAPVRDASWPSGLAENN